MANLYVGYRAHPITMQLVKTSSHQHMLVANRAFKLFEAFLNRAPLRSRSHLQDHSLRMLNNLEAIKGKAGAPEILIPAIILHDVGLLYSQDQCHGSVSAEKVRPHLSDLGLPQKMQDAICSVIRSHDDKSFVDNSREAVALRQLDNIDAFGEIGVYRFLEINKRRGVNLSEIFNVSLRSLITRRETLRDQLFKINDMREVHDSYITAVELMYKGSAEVAETGKSSLIEGLESIDWQIERLEELLRRTPTGFARDFFLDLSQAHYDFNV